MPLQNEPLPLRSSAIICTIRIPIQKMLLLRLVVVGSGFANNLCAPNAIPLGRARATGFCICTRRGCIVTMRQRGLETVDVSYADNGERTEHLTSTMSRHNGTGLLHSRSTSMRLMGNRHIQVKVYNFPLHSSNKSKGNPKISTTLINILYLMIVPESGSLIIQLGSLTFQAILVHTVKVRTNCKHLIPVTRSSRPSQSATSSSSRLL